MEGRPHYYEGMNMYRTTFPYRVMGSLGIKNMIITCATGGTNYDIKYPAIHATTDYINWFGKCPLIGLDLPDRFVNMASKFD